MWHFKDSMESEDLMIRLFNKFDFAIVSNAIWQNSRGCLFHQEYEILQLQDDHLYYY